MSDSRTSVVGRVTRVFAGRIVVTAAGQPVTVFPVSGAYVRSGAATTANLTDFVVGDEVAVEGTRNGNKFAASYIASTLAPFSAVVRGHSGNTLRTTIGQLVVDQQVLAEPVDFASLSSNSTEIQGLAWRDPASGVFHAVKLDVRTVV